MFTDPVWTRLLAVLCSNPRLELCAYSSLLMPTSNIQLIYQISHLKSQSCYCTKEPGCHIEEWLHDLASDVHFILFSFLNLLLTSLFFKPEHRFLTPKTITYVARKCTFRIKGSHPKKVVNLTLEQKHCCWHVVHQVLCLQSLRPTSRHTHLSAHAMI